MTVGATAALMIVAETVFLLAIVLGPLLIWGL
jgi:hypothetical protein